MTMFFLYFLVFGKLLPKATNLSPFQETILFTRYIRLPPEEGTVEIEHVVDVIQEANRLNHIQKSFYYANWIKQFTIHHKIALYSPLFPSYEVRLAQSMFESRGTNQHFQQLWKNYTETDNWF